MTPQLYITLYKEQFASPGRVKRAQPRPTSAHRRNNPQPRPDFLLPWSIQPSYRAANAQPHPSLLVDSGPPLFPPVRHLSFHSPVTTSPGNYLNAVNLRGPQHMPPVNLAAEKSLPSADKLQTLQLTEPNAALKNPQRRMDYQGNVNPLSTARQHAGVRLQTRPQTSNSPAASHHFPRIRTCRPRSNSNLDYSSCYSCFHVVKPYQTGHYIIHPEFVSECFS